MSDEAHQHFRFGETLIKVGMGVFLAWVGYRLSGHREVVARRREFRQLIRVHIEKFESIDGKRAIGGELLKMYQGSLTDISAASLKVVEDIPKKRRTRFQEVRRTYLAMTFQDIETHRNESKNMAGPNMWVPDIAEGKRKITELLTELLRCAA